MSEQEAVYILLPDSIPALKDAQEGDGAKARDLFGDMARRLDRDLTPAEKKLLQDALLALADGVPAEKAFMSEQKRKRGLRPGRGRGQNFGRDYAWHQAIDDLLEGERVKSKAEAFRKISRDSGFELSVVKKAYYRIEKAIEEHNRVSREECD